MLDPQHLNFTRDLVMLGGVILLAYFVWMFLVFFVADRRRYRR